MPGDANPKPRSGQGASCLSVFRIFRHQRRHGFVDVLAFRLFFVTAGVRGHHTRMAFGWIGRADGEAGGEEGLKQAALKRPSKVYSGGATIRKFEPKTASKRDKNAAKRGGTGKRAFKSKAKHKRR